MMDLKEKEFKKIREKIYDYCGINLHDGKHALVRARVMKRLRKLKLNSFEEYLDFLDQDNSGMEFLSLVDVLTTNKTSFFRESKHFDFIRDEVIPPLKERKRVTKWWSAGCSTGEEAVSSAIVLLEEQVSPNAVKILGTDISRDVIKVAKKAVYDVKSVAQIPRPIRNKYFRKVEKGYQVHPKVRNMITYGRLNLKKKWPLDGPFHVIMCRNVMIYFNRETQQELISRFYDILEPGGYLFLGHSESVAGGNKLLKNIRPAVYQKQ